MRTLPPTPRSVGVRVSMALDIGIPFLGFALLIAEIIYLGERDARRKP